MYVKIRCQKKDFKFKIKKGKTVKELKNKIFNETECKIPTENQKLMWKGKTLTDSLVLNESMKNFLVLEMKKFEWTNTNERRLCRNLCGFHGQWVNDWYCSKCYQIQKEEKCDEKDETIILEDINEMEIKSIQEDTKRCWFCNHKIGLLGFSCKCSYIFCAKHRYVDEHSCTFDWKKHGRKQIEKDNSFKKRKILDSI